MTGKELLKRLQQEKFDVERYRVVFVDDQGDHTGIADVVLDKEAKKVLLMTAGDTEVVEEDEPSP